MGFDELHGGYVVSTATTCTASLIRKVPRFVGKTHSTSGVMVSRAGSDELHELSL